MAIYVYDITIRDIYSTEDYGTISSAVTATDDFGVGTLSSTPTIADDFYSINVSSSQIPFGSINVSGTQSTAIVKSNLVRGTFVTFGTAGKVQGSNWVGFGTVFEIGHGLDRTLRPYVSSGTLRLGVYTIPRGITFNSQIISFAQDNGVTVDQYYVGLSSAIVSKTSNPPENIQLFGISGSASNIKKVANPPENTELFRISGSYSNLKSTKSNVGLGTATFSGSSKVSYQPGYVGSGTLFEVGIKSESRSYVYDKSSILYYDINDYGSVGVAVTISENYGLITQIPTPEDFGLLVGFGATQTILPFGSAYFSGQGSSRVISVYTHIASGQPGIKISGKDIIFPDVRIIPHYGKDKNIGVGTTGIQLYSQGNQRILDSYVGLGTIRLSGGNIYVKVVKQPQSTQLFAISGRAAEKFSPNPPENTQLFTISGSYNNLKSIKSNVGLGTIRLSGTNIERRTNSYVGLGTIRLSGGNIYVKVVKQPQSTQLFIISGRVVEKFAPNPPENTELFTISGSYNNLKSIKSNVGLGTIRLSGTNIEKFVTQSGETTQLFIIGGTGTEKYNKRFQGIPGIIQISGKDTVFPNVKIIPHYGKDKNIGVGTTGIQLYGGSIDHSNRYPDPGGGLPAGSGIGTIRINDDTQLTFYRANIPYISKNGLFKVSGRGNESYVRRTYIGVGTAVITGISSTRKISVFTGVGSGTVNIDQTQTLSIFKQTRRYVGLTSIVIEQSNSIKKQIHAYRGSGTITELSGSANSFARISRTNTILYNFSGSSSVYKVSNPTENTQLFNISGTYNNLQKTSSDVGIGTFAISGSVTIQVQSAVSATGLFKFITHTSDNVYDTVDSTVSVDYVDAARVKFIANSPENTQLFTIFGSAITSKRVSRSYVGIAGTVILSGSAINIKKTKSYAGIGTIFEISSGSYKDIRSYKGSGSITILSGSAKSSTKKPVTTSVLYTISGISSTKINHIVRISGIGTVRLSGISTTRKLSRVSISGIGTIQLSGQLLYPNIKFVPAPKATGSITILGSSSKSHSKPYKASGSLFGFSAAFQSYARKPYIGIGTVRISAISGITVNNPYQIPRSYVIII